MNTLEYFRMVIKKGHQSFIEAVKDLSDAQIHFRPLGKGNSIAFLLWHYARTEDILMNVSLQKKKPIWNVAGWDQKFGMDARSQGTGMTSEQAAAIRINDLGGFLKYAEDVFRASEAYLETVKEETLDEVRDFSVIGKLSVRNVIGGMVLDHAAGHLGEIWYVKGLQGLKGSPV